MSEAASLRGASWLTSGTTARVLALLNGDGEEARVVGGAVRNALLDIPISDIDIATTALPEEVVRRARAAGIKNVPTGIEHGTVTLIVDGQPFEVTTLREDVETFGRKAKVAFGRDWKADAQRRDFTINALSVDAGDWCTIMSEASPTSPRGGCDSSAIPTSGLPRIICGSFASSGFTQLMAWVISIAPVIWPASVGVRDCRRSRPNGFGWKC
jgi:hypothetical protein